MYFEGQVSNKKTKLELEYSGFIGLIHKYGSFEYSIGVFSAVVALPTHVLRPGSSDGSDNTQSINH